MLSLDGVAISAVISRTKIRPITLNNGSASSTWLVAITVAMVLASWIVAFATTAAAQDNSMYSENTHGAKVVRSLLELRHEDVIIQKWDLSCGAAALATLLTYQHGDPTSEVELVRSILRQTDPLKVRVRLGFSLLDLKRFVMSRGYEGIGYREMTLQDLIDLAPVMVPVQFSGLNHFVIFRGMSGNRVLLADPAFGNRTLRAERFEAVWEAAEQERIGFIVRRRDGIAPLNRLVPQAEDVRIPSNAVIRNIIR